MLSKFWRIFFVPSGYEDMCIFQVQWWKCTIAFAELAEKNSRTLSPVLELLFRLILDKIFVYSKLFKLCV